jgi:hypothetical protein
MIASLLCPSLASIALCYGLLCAASPFKRCRHCGGAGRLMSRGRFGRPCSGCHAVGIRIRYGRHLWNVVARIHRDGTR